MHELALAESMLQVVEDAARRNATRKVTAVTLEVGTLSAVEPDALAFCFNAVARGTIAEGARLDITATPGAAWCTPCNDRVPLGARHAPDVSNARKIQIEEDILARNNSYARANRRWLADCGIFALNLVSSPGSGKTTLLVRTIERLAGRLATFVVEGDQQTSRDADRIRATGAPAVQINTGKGCHLDAQMVGAALNRLQPADGSLLMIENVGNLVCPAAFDLGEAHKVVVLSVTEGDDKPLKYPDMFHAAGLLLINKIDLLPHVDFDVEAAVAFAHRVRPGLEVIRCSAQSGDGFGAWLEWLERGVARAKAARDADNSALRRRIAELEAALGKSADR